MDAQASYKEIDALSAPFIIVKIVGNLTIYCRNALKERPRRASLFFVVSE